MPIAAWIGFPGLLHFLNAQIITDLIQFSTAFLNQEQYGIPSRITTDQGGKNVKIWHFTEETCGKDRGSYITGSRSVHNTRIERLWRDVNTGVSSIYVSVFSDLEKQNMLDPDNDRVIFCLHYVLTYNQFQSPVLSVNME